MGRLRLKRSRASKTRWVILVGLLVCAITWAAAASADHCQSDQECDDGLWCNGEELCAPGAGGADDLGCIPSNEGPRCEPGFACLEEPVPPYSADTCIREECLTLEPDADGDGHKSIRCGGDDCDDNDRSRYPGNVEICDFEGHDEDCDLGTFHSPLDGDPDGDGFIDARCWNDPRQPFVRWNDFSLRRHPLPQVAGEDRTRNSQTPGQTRVRAALPRAPLSLASGVQACASLDELLARLPLGSEQARLP
ncbi:MAG: hypothetical protein GY937_16595 [bacterium]|nr:hypothetical protein [bacterium]